MRSTGNRYRLLITGGILAAALLSMRYLLPLALPFLVGLAVAWIAEPLARFLSRRAKFPRTLATGAAIGGVYLLLLGLVYLLGRLALQRWTIWPPGCPEWWKAWTRLPAGSRVGCTTWPKTRRSGCSPGLEESITQLFSNGSALAEGAVSRVLGPPLRSL